MKTFKSLTSACKVICAVALGSGIMVATDGAHAAKYEQMVYYAGAGYGIASIDEGDFDDDSGVLKAFVGTQFNKNIAAELTISDYGDAEDGGFESDLTGASVAMLGIMPLADRFDLFAKVGYLWWKNKVSFLIFSDESSGSEFFFGVGGEYNFTEQFGIRVAMERYDADLDIDEVGFDLNSFSVDVASVSAVFNF